MTPRIAPLADYGEDLATVLAKTLAAPSGDPYNLFTTLARHPKLLSRFNALGGLFMAHNELPDRDREIVILRVAARTGCAYEWAQHLSLARHAGVSEEELCRLADSGSGPTGWSDGDRTLLELTDLLLGGLPVGDELWEALERTRSDSELMELLMLPGFYRMLAGFINAIEIEVDDGLPDQPALSMPGADAANR